MAEGAPPKGGEILLTQAVRDLISPVGYRLTEFGPTILPGFDEPARVFALAWWPGEH